MTLSSMKLRWGFDISIRYRVVRMEMLRGGASSPRPPNVLPGKLQAHGNLRKV